MFKKLRKKNNKAAGHLINIVLTFTLFLFMFAVSIDLSLLLIRQITVTNMASDVSNRMMIQGGAIGKVKAHDPSETPGELTFAMTTNKEIIDQCLTKFQKIGINKDQWKLIVSGPKDSAVLYEDGRPQYSKKVHVPYKEVGDVTIQYKHDWFFSGGASKLNAKWFTITAPFVSDYFNDN